MIYSILDILLSATGGWMFGSMLNELGMERTPRNCIRVFLTLVALGLGPLLGHMA